MKTTGIKALLLITFILGTRILSFSQESADPFPLRVKRTPIWNYTVGDEFYFLEMPLQREKNRMLCNLTSVFGCDENSQIVTESLSYEDIAGKRFRIIKKETCPDNNFPDKNHFYYQYLLATADNKDCMTYSTTLDTNAFKNEDGIPYAAEDYCIYGAIFLKDILECRSSLHGPLWARFPIQGKQHEEVKVLNVDIGTWETPIRIRYIPVHETDTSKAAFINVNVSGTNVPDSYLKNFLFETFFTCKNPQPSDILKGRWENIRNGLPTINMKITKKELKQVWGDPVKTNQTENSTGSITVFTYQKFTITYKNNSLESIEVEE